MRSKGNPFKGRMFIVLGTIPILFARFQLGSSGLWRMVGRNLRGLS